MKRKLMVLMALSMFTAATPVIAGEMANHGGNHTAGDVQCERECDLLLKDCANQVDSIQDRIKKLQTAINVKGANTYTRDELKLLQSKLQDANETLRVLNRH